MKACSRYGLAFVTGSVLLTLFLTSAVWGLYPLAGQTLPQLVSERWSVSFRTSAFLVAAVVAATGTGAVTVLSLRGGTRPEEPRQSVKEAPHAP